MILNHAATDTAVQWKLCQNFKYCLLKNFERYDFKSCNRKHCGPVEVMPKFQISPSQKLRKNMILNYAATHNAVQRKLCPNFKYHLLKNLENI